MVDVIRLKILAAAAAVAHNTRRGWAFWRRAHAAMRRL
jgi:hypothetical protein